MAEDKNVQEEHVPSASGFTVLGPTFSLIMFLQLHMQCSSLYNLEMVKQHAYQFAVRGVADCGEGECDEFQVISLAVKNEFLYSKNNIS